MFTSIYTLEAIMQLIYRGVKHDSQSATLKVREAAAGGKYRGQVWNRHVLAETSVPQPLYALKYRGAAYAIGQVETAKIVEPMAVKLPTGSVLGNLLPQVSRL
ncbi:MAG: DUF4278 domain-containing protein, partial [Alkalinema sp. RL_2_19]|nr:DUF4278 domain-containing protein [Alkalinema sp. RL_2_19]